MSKSMFRARVSPRDGAIVAVASDHAGFELKQHLVHLLAREGVEVADLGPADTSSVDYPDYAAAVAAGIAGGRFGSGVLVCGSGQGMAITANRFPKVRATLCLTAEMARLARQQNDSNVLVMAGRMTGKAAAGKVLRTWLDTEFEGGRHQRRLEKIETCSSKFAPRGQTRRRSC